MRHEEINIHQRKRQSGKKGMEPYPSRKQKYRLVDKIVSVTAVIYPVAPIIPDMEYGKCTRSITTHLVPAPDFYASAGCICIPA